MTTPAQPATGDPVPATGDASPTTTEEISPEEPTTAQPATGTDEWASTFDGMTPAEVQRALNNSRKWEARAKQNKQALDDFQTKNTVIPEGEPTPDDWKAKLADSNDRADAAEARAAEMAYRDTIRSLAPKAKADAEALLDSSAFRDAIVAELGDDFDDDDLAAAVEKHAKQFAKQARFAIAAASPTPTPPPPPPARGSGEFPGASGAGQPITEEQLASMSPEEITEALNAGRLKHLL